MHSAWENFQASNAVTLSLIGQSPGSWCQQCPLSGVSLRWTSRRLLDGFPLPR